MFYLSFIISISDIICMLVFRLIIYSQLRFLSLFSGTKYISLHKERPQTSCPNRSSNVEKTVLDCRTTRLAKSS